MSSLFYCRLVVKGITPPSLVEHWHPLIVMCNPNSGGKDGQTILSTFRKLLNPVQVLDLTEFGPEVGLEICRFLPDHTCRVLACGGDGTVGWILGAIDKADLPVSMHVQIRMSSTCKSSMQYIHTNVASRISSHVCYMSVTCLSHVCHMSPHVASSPCGYPTPGYWQ